MLRVGAIAPEFEADATDGRRLSLSMFRGKAVVLYFFPKAFTPICTRETGRFRDSYAELVALGAEVIGVSSDPFEMECEFSRSQRVPFPLLADPDRRICSAYGVLWPLVPRARRITFVIGDTGLIELVLSHEFQVSKHLDGVLLHLQARHSGASAIKNRTSRDP
ncbi:MAG TPA: peroxiredoxin [Polyangiaceae bacterium]|nr:peroxiredoxin [Polyangiaceae bacterium]